MDRLTKRTYGLFATLAAVVIGLFLMPGASLAAEQIRIALLPFNVYTKGNAAFVQNAVYDSLARELQKTKDVSLLEKDAVLALTKGETLSETDALALGRRSQLTHVLTGSFTEIGEEINIDCRILDVENDKAQPVLSVQGKGMGSLGILTARLRGRFSCASPHDSGSPVSSSRETEDRELRHESGPQGSQGNLFLGSPTVRGYQGHLQARLL
jgi:TolB-like protein